MKPAVKERRLELAVQVADCGHDDDRGRISERAGSPVFTSACTKYISLRGPEMGKRARTAGRNSEIQAEHSGGEMGVQGANIWPIQANEGWC